jgi:hypothetical protein
MAIQGERIYYVGRGTDTDDTLLQLLRESGTAHETSFCVFAPPRGFPEFPKELSSEQIGTLAEHCVAIIVTAYDDEGFVVWVPKALG